MTNGQKLVFCAAELFKAIKRIAENEQRLDARELQWIAMAASRYCEVIRNEGRIATNEEIIDWLADKQRNAASASNN